jgi:hypothetical protein
VRAARAAALVGLAAAPACAIALGVQSDPKVVAETICACDEWHDIPSCRDDLEARLAGAPASERASWLQTFAASCSKTCADMHACFYTSPGCVQSGNACTADPECCSYPSFPPDAGVCKGHNDLCQ